MTKDERDLLHEIDTKLATYIERASRLIESQDRIKLDVSALKKTVYENGLNTRVKELHDWMLGQKVAAMELQKQNDQQEHEATMQGKKLSAETKQIIIQGIISTAAVIATAFLSK